MTPEVVDVFFGAQMRMVRSFVRSGGAIRNLKKSLIFVIDIWVFRNDQIMIADLRRRHVRIADRNLATILTEHVRRATNYCHRVL